MAPTPGASSTMASTSGWRNGVVLLAVLLLLPPPRSRVGRRALTTGGRLLVGATNFNRHGTANTSPPAPAASSVLDEGRRRPHYDFDGLSGLIRRLDALEGTAADTLAGFYEPRLCSFSVKPGVDCGDGGRNRDRVCVTSTCYALLTLALSSRVYDSLVDYSSSSSSSSHCEPTPGGNDEESSPSSSTRERGGIASAATVKIPIRRVVRALWDSEWREDDMFQVPLVLYTILRVDADRSMIRSALAAGGDDGPRGTAARVRRLLATVLDARPRRRLGTRQVHSDYMSYQVCKVIAQLQGELTKIHPSLSSSSPASSNGTGMGEEVEEGNGDRGGGQIPEGGGGGAGDVVTAGGFPANVLSPNMATDVFDSLLGCIDVSMNELCRQLAYRTAGDSNSFDVVRLAYSLLTYVRSTEALSGLAGREAVGGGGVPSPETRVSPVNRRLVAAALSAYCEEQNDDGMWDRGQPIYKSFAGGRGRDMGNAFVFPVNTVGSLLCALPAEDFRPHLDALERTLSWIEGHRTVEMITDYCDVETGQCFGRPLRGWTSPHAGPDTGPQAWPTAQVLKCVSWMRDTIRQLMHNDVLEEFHGIPFSRNGPQAASWDRLLDTDLGNPSKEGGCRTIKCVLEERVVRPFATSIDSPSYGAAYSAILFGPPGTAKTTICEALAQRMGYDFCVIDTAAFLADGLTNVAARIRYVFRRLMALKRCVILFDEIEEFALDRENPGLSMESRMLTTAMLTAINDLRKKKQSVFFIATNRLRSFDSAIIRPGRFDMQLFVGTPNLESRVVQFEQALASAAARGGVGGRAEIDDGAKERAVEAYRAHLDSVWTQDAMFMNYLEGMQFASSCADIVLANGRLTSREMSAILRQQAAVMTVRGSARDEYVASMELSRL